MTAPEMDRPSDEQRGTSSSACPACGVGRIGETTYCEGCGALLPSAERGLTANRGLVALLVVVWVVTLVWVLVWLTGHALLLK
jgi:hypothetical protein